MPDDERSGHSTRREFDRTRVEAFRTKTKEIGIYSQMETLDCIEACLAEIDRLMERDRLTMEVFQEGYRRGLEEAAKELWDYFHRQPENVIPGLEDYMDAIQALMDTPKEKTDG